MRKFRLYGSFLLALIMCVSLVVPAHAGYDGDGTVVDGGAGGATL